MKNRNALNVRLRMQRILINKVMIKAGIKPPTIAQEIAKAIKERK